jgi:hypothetical protein
MSKIILIQHPDNRNIYYNANQIIKIEKETTSIYWFHFSNGESVRIYDIDIINKIREITDIRF